MYSGLLGQKSQERCFRSRQSCALQLAVRNNRTGRKLTVSPPPMYMKQSTK